MTSHPTGTYVRPFTDAVAPDTDAVGGKAAGLFRLAAAGLPVPDGFCVLRGALTALLAGSPPALAARRRACLETTLPDRLAAEIADALARLRARCAGKGRELRLMVRSSAAHEDDEDHPGSGVYTSLGAPATEADLVQAMRAVWASGFTEAAAHYRARRGMSALDPEMGLVVQRYVDAAMGGAISTADADGGDAATLIVTWVRGHPAGLLGGTDDGEAAAIPKADLDQGASGLDERLASAASGALTAEHRMRRPLELEFIVDAGGGAHFVQMRAIPFTPRWRRRPDYVGAPEDEEALHSPKLRPFRYQSLAEGRPSDQVLVRPTAFEAFRRDGWSADGLRPALSRVFERFVRSGPVSVRPVFWSLRDAGRSLPQSGRIASVDAGLGALEALWTYALANGLDDYSAEVGALVGNWHVPVASAVGTARPDDDIATVAAIHGYPEGLEMLAHDVVTVDLGTGEIVDEAVASKPLAVGAPHAAPSPVAAALQDVRVLTRTEASSIARVLRRCVAEERSPVRVEFLITSGTGERRVVTWQIDGVTASEARSLYWVVRRVAALAPTTGPAGRAFLIRRVDDLAARVRRARQRHERWIALVDITSLNPRDRELCTFIASAISDLGAAVVLRGSPLSHFASLCREFGLQVHAARELDRTIRDGDLVALVEDRTARGGL